MKFVPLINLKLLTIANSFLLYIDEYEILSATKYENAHYCLFSYLLAEKISCSTAEHEKKFDNLGTRDFIACLQNQWTNYNIINKQRMSG